MGQCLAGGEALGRVPGEHLLEELQGFGGERAEGVGLVVDLAVAVLTNHFLDVLALEERLLEHQDVEDHSQREDVACAGVGLHRIAGLDPQHLGRDVAWCAAPRVEILRCVGVLS